MIVLGVTRGCLIFDGDVGMVATTGARKTGGSSKGPEAFGTPPVTLAVRGILGFVTLTKASMAPFFIPAFAIADFSLAFREANFFGFRMFSSHISTVSGTPIFA